MFGDAPFYVLLRELFRTLGVTLLGNLAAISVIVVQVQVQAATPNAAAVRVCVRAKTSRLLLAGVGDGGHTESCVLVGFCVGDGRWTVTVVCTGERRCFDVWQMSGGLDCGEGGVAG